MKVSFTVTTSQWGAEDEVFLGGRHTVEDASDEFLKLLACAEAAGSVKVTEYDGDFNDVISEHVQSQEDGEAAYEFAVQQKRWQWGNLTQFVTDRETLLELHQDESSDVELTDTQLEFFPVQIAHAKAELAAMEESQ